MNITLALVKYHDFNIDALTDFILFLGKFDYRWSSGFYKNSAIICSFKVNTHQGFWRVWWGIHLDRFIIALGRELEFGGRGFNIRFKKVSHDSWDKHFNVSFTGFGWKETDVDIASFQRLETINKGQIPSLKNNSQK